MGEALSVTQHHSAGKHAPKAEHAKLLDDVVARFSHIRSLFRAFFGKIYTKRRRKRAKKFVEFALA